MYNYLNDLNEIQRKAVEYIKGPSLIIAGAGSGKTRVLTYKIAHLLRLGNHPATILALTFTNKAAREMKERIGKIVGAKTASQLWMGTFHSIFARILRYEADTIGFPKNYTIYDTTDSRNLIKTIVKELQLDSKIYSPRQIHSKISKAKNNLITPPQYKNNYEFQQADRVMRQPATGQIYEIYVRRCYKSGAMDFDDLLVNTLLLLKNNKTILAKYQDRFRYILVDEYQDTNFVQYFIVKLLAAAHKNVCVVGDDSQSIYSFRGARIENILHFQKDYPNNKLFKLEQNYRSTQNIVDAANSIIEKNKNRIPKVVWSDNDVGNKIDVKQFMNELEEAINTVNGIIDARYSNHIDFKDVAILYRTNAQSRSFEEALRKRNIPYKIYSGVSFYQRKEIKDLLAYYRLVVNPKDDEALKRIINYPKRGIGDTTIQKLESIGNNKGISLWETICNIHKISSNIGMRTVNRIAEFTKMIQEFMQQLQQENAYNLARDIASKCEIIKELYQDKTPEGISRYENIQELLNGIKEFVEQNDQEPENLTLDNFLQEVSLLTNEDTDNEDDNDKVSLMTIHSSKGLEFEYIYLVGLEENLFPSEMSSKNPKDLEEERRLFYVAVTRAKKHLTISCAKNRYRWGQQISPAPSRFISEIDNKFVNLPDALIEDYCDAEETFDYSPSLGTNNKYFSKQTTNQQNLENFEAMRKNSNSETMTFDPVPTNRKLKKIKENNKKPKVNTNFQPSDAQKIQAGMQVEHQRFGYGKVLNLDGTYPNVKATIFFHHAGQKQLLLKFAKLKIIKG